MKVWYWFNIKVGERIGFYWQRNVRPNIITKTLFKMPWFDKIPAIEASVGLGLFVSYKLIITVFRNKIRE